MANEQNLIPTNRRSKSETRELGRKGGINSGKARREKKTFGQIASLLLDLSLRENGDRAEIEVKKSLQGVAGENVSVKVALMLALIKKGLDGDIAAIDKLICLIGDRTDNRKKNQLEEDYLEWRKKKLETVVNALSEGKGDGAGIIIVDDLSLDGGDPDE